MNCQRCGNRLPSSDYFFVFVNSNSLKEDEIACSTCLLIHRLDDGQAIVSPMDQKVLCFKRESSEFVSDDEYRGPRLDSWRLKMREMREFVLCFLKTLSGEYCAKIPFKSFHREET